MCLKAFTAIRHFSVAPYITICPSTETLFKRGDVSSNWSLSFSSATKYYILCHEIFFYLNKQCLP